MEIYLYADMNGHRKRSFVQLVLSVRAVVYKRLGRGRASAAAGKVRGHYLRKGFQDDGAMKKLFLFDFDGVLVDSLDFYVHAVGLCLKEIGTPIVQNKEDYLALFEGNFYEAMASKGVDLVAFSQAAHEILPGLNYDQLTPFPGLAPVLAALHRDHVLAVISSNGSQTIKAMLEKFQYDAYFQDVFGSDFLFSKVDKISHALEKFGMEGERTFYIGDTTGDVHEAREAGVITVAVAWGWHSREKLAAAHPDYLIDRPEELLAL